MWSNIMLNLKRHNHENGFLKPEYPFKSATYINQSECTLLCYCLEFLELIDVACSIQKKTALLLMSLLQIICTVACPKPIVGKCLLKTLTTVGFVQAICLGTVQVTQLFLFFFIIYETFDKPSETFAILVAI